MKEFNNVIFEKDAIKKFCQEVKNYNRVFILTSPTPKNSFLQMLANLLNENKTTFWAYCLPKGCICNSDNVLKTCSNVKGADVIVSLGAGTVCDIAKIAAKNLKLPLIVVPTTITHYGIFNNISVLNDGLPQIIETNYPSKVFVDEAIIHKSPEVFISSTLCFAISMMEQSFSLEAKQTILQENNVNIELLNNKIKKIEELTGWLSLSKSFAILNLMDYIYDLSQILNSNYENNSIILASMLNCSTLKKNFGEKSLLCCQILLKTYYEFFKQKLIAPKNIPEREKIIQALSQRPNITSINKKYQDPNEKFENYIFKTNSILSQAVQLKLQNSRLKLLELCLKSQISVSKFLNRIKLINPQTQSIRMIDENELFSCLQLLPLNSSLVLPSLISRYGYLNVI